MNPAPLARLRWQTALVFLVAAAAYFALRTPALDEWDSVQFALGVGDFNLWRHHPHPPGYPLYELAGWVFSRALPLGVPDALQLASALGGGLFVASWFALGAQAFGRTVGAWSAVALGTLLITVMTATKALTDGLGAGLLALALLLARNRRLVPAALAGAAAAGVRPQTFPVALLVVGVGLAQNGSPRRWGAVLGAFLGGCLAWLGPTAWLQARTPEAGGSGLAYPAQLLAQWRWRLDQPRAFVGADTHGQSFLAYRLDHHLLGWFTRGLGFPLDTAWGWLGLGVLAAGWVFYGVAAQRERLEPVHRRFWRFHLPWALLHVGIVFCCLPGDQRYYLPVFPLLLVPAVAGWAAFFGPGPGHWLAAAVPAATLLAMLPFVAENHREAAPPVRMLGYLRAAYPPADRAHVRLLLRDSRRHAEWYAPDFALADARQTAVETEPPPLAAYTDDPGLVAASPPGSWRLERTFARSPLIYRKHSEVKLYRRVDR